MKKTEFLSNQHKCLRDTTNDATS